MISVVLATARPSRNAIAAWPDRDHLAYTLGHLAAQSHRDFEVIIADTLIGTALRDLDSLRVAAATLGVPVYHVPVESPWVERANWAISGSRNSGFAHAAGEFIVFLDDLSAPGPEALAAYWLWYQKGKFLNALHGWLRGDEVHPTVDARLGLLSGGQMWMFDVDFNAHMSASAKALEQVNGFDEFYDGSRQLEDGDLSRRLRQAGHHTVIDRRVTIREQMPVGSCVSRTGALLGPTTRCNGTWIFLKQVADWSGYIEANRRPLTEAERAATRPCRFLAPDKRCMMQPGNPNPCNFVRLDGTHHHDDLADEFLVAPVFDLAERRRAGLAEREKWRLG